MLDKALKLCIAYKNQKGVAYIYIKNGNDSEAIQILLSLFQ